MSIGLNNLLKRAGITTPETAPVSTNVGTVGAVDHLGAEIAAEVADGISAISEITEMTNVIEELAEASASMANGVDVIMAIAAKEAGENVAPYLNKRDVTMINAAFAAAGSPLQLGSVESWGKELDVVRETEGAVESVKDKAKDFWRYLVDNFYKFLEFIAGKLSGLFGTAEKMKARAAASAKKSQAYTGDVKKDKIKVNVKVLSIGEAFKGDVSSIKELTSATSKVCVEFPSTLKDAFGDIQTLLENEGKMAEYAKTEGNDEGVTAINAITVKVAGAMPDNLITAEAKFLGNFYIEQAKEEEAKSLTDAVTALKGTKYYIKSNKWTKDVTREMAPVSLGDATKIAEAVGDLADALIEVRAKITDVKKFKSEIEKVKKAGEKAASEDGLKAASYLPKGLGTAAAVIGTYANGSLTASWVTNSCAAGNAMLDYAAGSF